MSEAVDRVFRQHWWMIAALVLLGMGGLLFHTTDVPRYAASTRFVLDTSDPQSPSQSQAIADTARAIATGPAQVASALKRIGVRRDAVDVAAHNVTVDTIGTSGVLNLTVTDPNGAVAVRLANALALVVIETRMKATNGPVTEIVRSLDTQIDSLTRQITSIDQKATDVVASIAARSDPHRIATLQARQAQLAQTRDYLDQRRSVLESERANISANDALRPQPSIIEAATPPATLVPPHRLYRAALGGLLGLFVGIALATFLEIFRPTVVGPSAIAEAVGIPLLGVLPCRLQDVRPSDLGEVATHVGVAAMTARVNRIEVVGVGGARLQSFSQVMESALAPLDASLHALTGVGVAPKRGGTRTYPADEPPIWVVVDALDLRGVPSLDGRKKAGLLLVTPTVVRRAALMPLKDLAIFGWPWLGMIAHPTHGRRRTLGQLIARMPRPNSVKLSRPPVGGTAYEGDDDGQLEAKP